MSQYGFVESAMARESVDRRGEKEMLIMSVLCPGICPSGALICSWYSIGAQYMLMGYSVKEQIKMQRLLRDSEQGGLKEGSAWLSEGKTGSHHRGSGMPH